MLYVLCVDASNMTLCIHCNWIPAVLSHTGSGAKSYTLPAVTEFERVTDTEYEVKILTGDIPGNGTDGDVYISLAGSRGASRETRVWPSDWSRGFDRGQTDTTTLTLPDLGDLSKVTISHRCVI